ncbi:MAG: hypothetical protein NTV77_00350 [Candidatus Azambacteria bacterium]|nr:hypothetical protein [Candidatus Azambacteria bacterium]
MENIQNIIDSLQKFTNAKSIFLYGSRARTDFYNESDYEVGVLIEKDKYISRGDIKDKFNFKGINIFPFYYEEFIAYNPDTPFVKSIYMREIIEAGKTLTGEKIIENLKPPEIKLLDIIQDLRFNLGYSLAATHSYREGDNVNASLHLLKSCLFGTRDYIILKLQKFPIPFDEILELSRSLDLKKYSDLPSYAYKLREREEKIDENKLFANISYLNKFIEKELLEAYNNQGNVVLIK